MKRFKKALQNFAYLMMSSIVIGVIATCMACAYLSMILFLIYMFDLNEQFILIFTIGALSSNIACGVWCTVHDTVHRIFNRQNGK